MIAVDTSAIIAILNDEPERPLFIEIIASASNCCISAASVLEARIVLFARSADQAVMAFDAFMLRSRLQNVDFTGEMGSIAFAAYRKFGSGTGHPAALNYGDCFSYALAKSLNAPLLFKGNDFGHTDLADAREVFKRPK